MYEAALQHWDTVAWLPAMLHAMLPILQDTTAKGAESLEALQAARHTCELKGWTAECVRQKIAPAFGACVAAVDTIHANLDVSSAGLLKVLSQAMTYLELKSIDPGFEKWYTDAATLIEAHRLPVGYAVLHAWRAAWAEDLGNVFAGGKPGEILIYELFQKWSTLLPKLRRPLVALFDQARKLGADPDSAVYAALTSLLEMRGITQAMEAIPDALSLCKTPMPYTCAAKLLTNMNEPASGQLQILARMNLARGPASARLKILASFAEALEQSRQNSLFSPELCFLLWEIALVPAGRLPSLRGRLTRALEQLHSQKASRNVLTVGLALLEHLYPSSDAPKKMLLTRRHA